MSASEVFSLVGDSSLVSVSPLGDDDSKENLPLVDQVIVQISPKIIASTVSSSSGPSSLSPQHQSFEANLAQWRDEKIGDGEYAKRVLAVQAILKAAQSNATILNLSNLGLTSLPTAIGMLTQLEALHLYGNNLKNIEVLSRLIRLRSLFLQKNQISDITPLGTLKELRRLFIYDNQIDDIKTLAEMPQLNTLYLSKNKIVDISPLAGLRNLFFLELVGNLVTDVSPLAGLDSLEVLNVSQNPITTIAPLGGMSHLGKLDVSRTLIETIPPSLSEMSNDATVDATATPLTHQAIREFQESIQKTRSQRADLGPEFILPYTAEISTYDMVADLGFSLEDRPVIARAAHATAPVMGPKTSILIDKLGAIPCDVDINLNDIDPNQLMNEVQSGIRIIRKDKNDELSVPVRLLKLARDSDNFPAIRKIQQVADEVVSKCHGLSLPGGPNIEREFYHEASELLPADYRRSIAEFALADAALRQGKPIMGNCRGAQLLNVFLGGTLKVGGSSGWGTAELTDSSKRGRLEAILGDSPVNMYSQHFQSCDRVAKGFEVVMEQNSIPKLLMTTDEMIIGIQSHPECDENERYSKAIEIYRLFFQKIKNLQIS